MLCIQRYMSQAELDLQAEEMPLLLKNLSSATIAKQAPLSAVFDTNAQYIVTIKVPIKHPQPTAELQTPISQPTEACRSTKPHSHTSCTTKAGDV